MKKNSIFVNTIIYTIKLFTSFLFPLVSQPYVNRILGVTQIGKYNFSFSFVSYFASIAGLGISTYAIKEGSKFRNDKKKIEKFCQNMLTINTFSMIVSLLILFWVITFSKQLGAYKNIIMLLSLEIPLVTFGTNWIFNIFEDYVYITVRSFIFQILAICLMFLFVKNEQDIYWYSLISVIAAYGSNTLNLIYSRKYFKFKFWFSKDSLIHIRPILILFASSLASQIYLNLDITMLGIIGDDYQVGIYSSATKIYTLARMTLSAFISIILPRIAECSSDRNKYIEMYTNAHYAYLTLLIPASFGLFGTSAFFISVFCGEAFVNADIPLSILSIALLFSSSGSFMANLVLLVNKEEKKILLATVVGAIVNFVGNILVLPSCGYIGAAITTLISEVVVFFIQYNYVRNYIIASIKEKLEIFKIIISSSIILLVCSIFNKMPLDKGIMFVFQVLISLVGYGVLSIIMKNRIVLFLIWRIRNKSKKDGKHLC